MPILMNERRVVPPAGSPIPVVAPTATPPFQVSSGRRLRCRAPVRPSAVAHAAAAGAAGARGGPERPLRPRPPARAPGPGPDLDHVAPAGAHLASQLLQPDPELDVRAAADLAER